MLFIAQEENCLSLLKVLHLTHCITFVILLQSAKVAMDLINGKTLQKGAELTKVAAADALAGKQIVCFYISAHWCPTHLCPLVVYLHPS